jgi:hypothetical protein
MSPLILSELSASLSNDIVKQLHHKLLWIFWILLNSCMVHFYPVPGYHSIQTDVPI